MWGRTGKVVVTCHTVSGWLVSREPYEVSSWTGLWLLLALESHCRWCRQSQLTGTNPTAPLVRSAQVS